MFRRIIPHLHALAQLQSLTVCGLGCRWASRDARVWVGQKRGLPSPGHRTNDFFIEDPDTDEVEDRLSALEREEKRRQAAIKFHKLRRQMDSRGPPERRLSWDAIEQIRYLKQERPEEWTVARLAEGFSVSTSVIHRVLRSKYIPSPERRAKQDSKVSAIVRQQSLPASDRPGEDRPQLPDSQRAMLPAGTGSALATLDHQSTSLGTDQRMGATAPSGGGESLGSLTLLPTPLSPVPQGLQGEHKSSLTQENEEEEDEEEDDGWDGRVLSDDELEELARTHTEQNYQVVQKGTEFFDGAGNFLYRI